MRVRIRVCTIPHDGARIHHLGINSSNVVHIGDVPVLGHVHLGLLQAQNKVGDGNHPISGISHIGSRQAQKSAQMRRQYHSQALQGQSIVGLSSKVWVYSRRPFFLSGFIVFVSPTSGVKPH